jgi:NADH-quinone oxidoreductase subunit D
MELETQPFVVNFGPHHPSTHGVFRLRLTLDGEVVVDVEPVYGYLHRGIEKLAEARTYAQDIPYTDRVEYRAGMVNNLAFALAVEELAGIAVPERAQYLRVIFAELMRIASHLTAVGFLCEELGAMKTPLIYLFREREKLLDLFDMVCGQRLTHNFMRIGGLSEDVPPEFMPATRKFVREMPHWIDEYDQLLKLNEIVLARTVGIGVLPADVAVNNSCSGPLLRASGVSWDIRRADPYLVYDQFDFDVVTAANGDVYDRYRVRIEEMRQSVRILEQALDQLPDGDTRAEVPTVLRPPKGEVYAHIEAGTGELGFYLVSDGSIAPYRFRIRPPSLHRVEGRRSRCHPGEHRH